MIFNELPSKAMRSCFSSSVSMRTYLPTKKNAGRRARRGITKDLDRRFRAQRSRKALSSDNGTKSSPTKDMSQTFAGFMSMERYDRIRSPATIIINRRDVIPNILFLAIVANQ
jgi:hypothetical protein